MGGRVLSEQEEAFEQLVQAAEQPIRDWFDWVARTADYHGHGKGELTYPTLSLSAEVGEVNGLLVKFMRRTKGGRVELNVSELSEAVRLKFAGEAYDVLHCLAFLIQELGLTLEDVIKIGKEKLEARIERGSQTASHRLDEKSLVGKTVVYCGLPYQMLSESIDSIELGIASGRGVMTVSRAEFYRGFEETEQ